MSELDDAIKKIEEEWKLYLRYGHKDKKYEMPNMEELIKLRIRREQIE